MDLTNLAPGQIALIAAIGAVAAAIISGTAALVAAIVNARSARALDRDRALREFRLAAVHRMLEMMEERRRNYEELTKSDPQYMFKPIPPDAIKMYPKAGAAVMSLSASVREAITRYVIADVEYWRQTSKGTTASEEVRLDRERHEAGRSLRNEIEAFLFR